MNYQCPLCSIYPNAHSLIKIKEIDDIVYLYSCPAQAKLYFDVDGIIKHYDGVLSEIPTNKQWIWIFDSKEFDFKHFIQINVGIQLAKLISSKFSYNLTKIIIINPTFYISSTYNVIYPFLNEKMKTIIQFTQYKSSIDVLQDI